MPQTEKNYPDFESLNQVAAGDFDPDEGEITWLDLDPGQSVVGEFVGLTEKAGQYENRLYKIRTDDGPVGIWGKRHLDWLFNQSGIEPGDVIGVKDTGETYAVTDEDGEPVLEPDGTPRTGRQYELRRLD